MQASLQAQPEHGVFTLTLSKYLSEAFRFTVERRNVRSQLCNLVGDPVVRGARVTCSPFMPDTITPAPDKHSFQTARVSLGLSTDGLPEGMYLLRALVIVDAVDSSTGQKVTLPAPRADLRIFVPPPPDKLPDMSAGQSFLCQPDHIQRKAGSPYTLASGRKLDYGKAMLRVFLLTSLRHMDDGRVMLTFSVHGVKGTVAFTGALDHGWPPALTPLVEDAEVRRLRAKYEGHRIWAFGGIQAEEIAADPGISGSVALYPTYSARVRSVLRTYSAGYPMAIGQSEDESGYVTDNPLVVVLDMPQKFSISGGGWASDHGVPAGFGSSAKGILAFLWRFSGAWDMERTYSLANPWKSKSWSTAMRRHIAKGELAKGMPHDMVAWAWGWPHEYGTAAEMSKLSAWRYDSLAPFEAWIYFKGDRVIRIDPGGSLP